MIDRSNSPLEDPANALEQLSMAQTPENDYELASLPDSELVRIVESLPKIELHRHLEGSLEPQDFLEVADKYSITLPTRDIEKLSREIQVQGTDHSLVQFLEKFKLIGEIFVSEEVIEDLSYKVFERAARDNVVHMELRFSPAYMAEAHGLDPEAVTDAVIRAKERAERDFDMSTALIVIAGRHRGLEVAEQMKDLAISRMDKGVVGFDLANDEYNFPPAPFAGVFKAAKAAGLKITVHAGEAAGPENIRTAIEELGADRIGHGVRAFEDPEVVRLLIERQTALELCPTSNVHTQAVKTLEDHPFKSYFDAGVNVTLNTDDPAVSDITFSDEVVGMVKTFGFTLSEVETITENAIEAAFIPESSKQKLRGTISNRFERTLSDLCG